MKNKNLDFGSYVKNQTEWSREINPDFYDILNRDIGAAKNVLVFDFGYRGDSNANIAGIGLIAKAQAKMTCFFDILEGERIMGWIHPLEKNMEKGMKVREIVLRNLKATKFPDDKWEKVKPLLEKMIDPDEECFILDLIRFYNDDDFWRYRSSKVLLSEQEANEMEMRRQQLKYFFEEDDEWRRLLTNGIFKALSIKKFWGEEQSFFEDKYTFIAVENGYFPPLHTQTMVDIILYQILSSSTIKKIFTVFDDEELIQNSLVWDIFDKQQYRFVNQKSYRAKTTKLVNYDHIRYLPKVSDILWKYNRMKYARKREFVNAEILARFGINDYNL